MKLTKSKLKQLIKEELTDRRKSSARGVGSILPTDVANMMIRPSGHFTCDIELDNGGSLSIDGQLDDNSLFNIQDLLENP